MRAMREQLPIPAASVGNRAPAVLRRREQRRSFLCERRRSRWNHARDARAAPNKGAALSSSALLIGGQQHLTRRRPKNIAPGLLARTLAAVEAQECLGGLLRSCVPRHRGGAQLARSELVQPLCQQILEFGDRAPFPEHIPVRTRRLLLFQLRSLAIGT